MYRLFVPFHRMVLSLSRQKAPSSCSTIAFFRHVPGGSALTNFGPRPSSQAMAIQMPTRLGLAGASSAQPPAPPPATGFKDAPPSPGTSRPSGGGQALTMTMFTARPISRANSTSTICRPRAWMAGSVIRGCKWGRRRGRSKVSKQLRHHQAMRTVDQTRRFTSSNRWPPADTPAGSG